MASLEKILPVLSLLLALPACATNLTLSSEPIEGVVREEGTNKPIPGAIVVVRWQGHLGYSGTICYHVETATTDDQGRYRIAAWNKPSPYGNIAQQHAIVKAYKPGYQLAKRYPVNNPLLHPSTEEREARLKYIENIKQSTVRCADSMANGKSLIPLYRVLYEEAKPLAQTGDEQSIADGFLSWIKILDRDSGR